MAAYSGWTPTHLDKIYWPEKKYTKGEMLNYYEHIASTMVPHLTDRPLVMKRFPEGIRGQKFFQKNVPGKLPAFVETVRVHARTVDRALRYILCNNAKTLQYVANLGAIELHPWGSRTGALDTPDVMMFDLDPGPKAKFSDVIETAHVLKEVLQEVSVASFVKTSGKRGLHVYVPMKPEHTYDRIHQLARGIAEEVATRHPKLISADVRPAQRRDKIFIDFLRNSFGQTAVAPYSVRAVPEASVSAPLEWKEVKKGLDPEAFTMKSMPHRLRVKGDLWRPLLERRVDISKALDRYAGSPSSFAHRTGAL